MYDIPLLYIKIKSLSLYILHIFQNIQIKKKYSREYIDVHVKPELNTNVDCEKIIQIQYEKIKIVIPVDLQSKHL